MEIIRKVEVKTASQRVYGKMTAEFMFIRLNFFSILYLGIIQMSPLFTLQLIHRNTTITDADKNAIFYEQLYIELVW